MGNEQTYVVVEGLTPEQRNSLLFTIDEEPIAPKEAGLRPTAMGDFGVAAVAFVASLAALAGIMKWVDSQEQPVSVKLEFLKFLKIEVSKNTTLEQVKDAAAKQGIDLKD